MPPTEKFQRWVDLLVALLAYRAGLTFADLAREVPAYANALAAEGAKEDSVKRTFERDKAELKALGIPIVRRGEEGEEHTRYLVTPREFYLPYLALATPRGVQAPEKVGKYGYMSLETLAFTADELLAIADGAARARQLGDPALCADVDSGMRKLAFDLPLDGVVSQEEAHIVAPRAAPDPAVLQLLGEALLGRKCVRFTYHTMESDARSARVVEPWGLFWANAHWYLAGRDTEKDAVRNFRVSRISGVAPANNRAATPDFSIPPDFDLREHARARQPWELGDGDAIDAVVELLSSSGTVMAAGALGAEVEGTPSRRRYRVRRADAFARWMLSLAGGVRPVGPPGIVDEYRRQLEATRRVYAS